MDRVKQSQYTVQQCIKVRETMHVFNVQIESIFHSMPRNTMYYLIKQQRAFVSLIDIFKPEIRVDLYKRVRYLGRYCLMYISICASCLYEKDMDILEKKYIQQGRHQSIVHV